MLHDLVKDLRLSKKKEGKGEVNATGLDGGKFCA